MSRFASFREFYPFYLDEHRNVISRRLHVVGSCAVLLLVALAIVRGQPVWLLAALACGYGFAWVGHFFFEKNRPATFRHLFFRRRLGDVPGHPLWPYPVVMAA